MPDKRMKRLFVTDSEFMIAKEESDVCIAGKLLSYTEREIKTGTMCSIQVDCNNTIIAVTVWPDAYINVLKDAGGNMLDTKGKVICISGTVRKDKFRNQKALFSNPSTRLYVIS